MTHSTEIDKLAAAILYVQKTVRPVRCNAVGDDGRVFADLSAVRAELQPRLIKAGLIVVQSGSLSLNTRIMHVESGQWVDLPSELQPGDHGDHRFGPRYALMQAFAMQQADDSVVTGLDLKGMSRAQVQVLINREASK